MTKKRRKPIRLGLFMNCLEAKDRCTKANHLERVVIKRDDDGLPSICICRLDPYSRKKFRGAEHDVGEERRKPFGTEKAPKHLRRCLEYDKDRKRCTKYGESIIKAPLPKE